MGNKITIVFATLLVLLLLNVGLLNYMIFSTKRTAAVDSIPAYNVVNVASDSARKESSGSGITDSCSPYSCVDLIRSATASSGSKGVPAVKKTSTSSQGAPANEYYIAFGSGETMSDQYEDIPGVAVYIDTTKYHSIRGVTFEASLRIPTANGTVYAQLFNATDGHPVWFSEVSTQANNSQLVISAPITLDSGNKLYKVQMKTTLKYQSILDQARVHIITQ